MDDRAESSNTELDASRSRADTATSYVDHELWRELAEAETREGFYESWLAIQCGRLGKVHRALVLAETEAEQTFAPAALWPNDDSASRVLVDVARASLTEEQPLVVDLQAEYGDDVAVMPDTLAVAYPLMVSGRPHCVVAVELPSRSDRELEHVMRELQWGAAWLETALLRAQMQEDEETIGRLANALYLAAAASGEERAQAAVTSFVTDLASRLECERVSCGFLRRGRVRVAALSNSGQFGRQMNLVNAIGAAMDEALDQNTIINYPADDEELIVRRHRELTKHHDGGAALTVPLIVNGRKFGAVTLERADAEPFDDDTVQFCRTLASVVGPVFRDKRLNDRWLPAKVAESAGSQLAKLLGPRYLGRKLAAGLAAAAIAFVWVGHGDFRVTADAVLEGAVERAVVAPFNGYVAEARLRAGDRVEAGDKIAGLDDEERRLELAELTSERAQALRQYNQARAQDDRAQARIYQARIDQADARIARVRQQLAQTRLEAPIDGVIVSGDLSQSLGGAVERGNVLFEVAPLDAYRVNLKVDERDISHVEPGQSGQLVLSALTDETHGITVQKVTPVTSASEGRNFFRVEAALNDSAEGLRPGMEGVAKLYVDQRRYAWLWTRELVNWLKLWTWRWMP